MNYFIEYIRSYLHGFNGKKAFIISWIYQLIGFILISIIYFTYMNFELYIINAQNFTVSKTPYLFDFIYYTIKTISFSNISTILPFSPLAKIIEIITWVSIDFLFLIIGISLIFSLRQEKIYDNMNKISVICIEQNKYIEEHITNNYHTDIHSVLIEASNIKASIEKIKKIIDRIF